MKNSRSQTKALPGWIRDRDLSIARRQALHGALESDIDKFNQKIRETREAERHFSETRRRLDLFLEKRRHEQELKEVWE